LELKHLLVNLAASSEPHQKAVKETITTSAGEGERRGIRQSIRDAINLAANEYAALRNTDSESATKRARIVSKGAVSAVGGGKGKPVPVVIVCGTAFIMSEARAELGVVEPRDGDSLALAYSGGSSNSSGSADGADDDEKEFQLDAQVR
jgi:hypothetical protein